ncbi:hypothetical protein NE237_029569 [Protea cynaroides]|uniref:Peptidase S8/S53 domain-containing protein n=1 Tax=Protea cynaroides TaxID=273540 RepID=A0A9Q0GVJ4_9MAGN|nr:hypothetical protein NE237_029569 [Protea cynaroides]
MVLEVSMAKKLTVFGIPKSNCGYIIIHESSHLLSNQAYKLRALDFDVGFLLEANWRSVITDSSPRGTHVAGIATAFHEKEPLLNGVAPGAQLISCKIEDSCLGSMENGTSLTRALIAAVEIPV